MSTRSLLDKQVHFPKCILKRIVWKVIEHIIMNNDYEIIRLLKNVCIALSLSLSLSLILPSLIN